MYRAPCGSGLGSNSEACFFVGTFLWFHGKRLRDTFHRTMRSMER
jgi:hypothetical protein